MNTSYHNYDFEKAYASIQYQIAPLETERTNLLAKKKQAFTVVAVAISLLIFTVFAFFLYKNPLLIAFGAIATIASIAIVGVQYNNQKQAYFEKIRGSLIPNIITSIRPNLNYEPWDSFDGKEFFNTKLFEKKVNRFSGEDYLEGKINNTNFRLSEIKLEREKRNKEGKKSYVTFFKGLLIALEIPNMPKGYVRVEKAKPDNLLLNFIEKFVKSDLEKFETDNTTFNQKYQLVGNNKELVNFAFTTSLLEAIEAINNKENTNSKDDELVEIAFTEEKAYFVIKHNRDLFLPQTSESLLDKASTQRFYNDLMYALDLVDILSR